MYNICSLGDIGFKMKTLSFKYTKKDGSSSDRVLVVMSEPNSFYAGIDISELDEAEQGMYLDRINRAHEAYLAEIGEINASFDTKYRYRRFDPKLMQINETEEI